jgi:hypothetical protein
MLTATTCPICYEPIDENGDCTSCGEWLGKEPEPFTDTDLYALHTSAPSGAYEPTL